MPAPAAEGCEVARADLWAITDYISDDNPDAAQQLKDDIEAKVSALPDHLKPYKRGRVAGTREMIVRSNYIIVYVEGAAGVMILRVLHVARAWPPA